MITNASTHASKSALTMRDVMTPAPHAIGSNQTLSFARQVMRDHRLRHLPVLKGGQLVGVLSLRDLQFLDQIAGLDLELDRVIDAMTSDVYMTRPNASLRDVAHAMAEKKHGCAVVLDGSQVVGIFTVTDALNRLAAELR